MSDRMKATWSDDDDSQPYSRSSHRYPAGPSRQPVDYSDVYRSSGQHQSSRSGHHNEGWDRRPYNRAPNHHRYQNSDYDSRKSGYQERDRNGDFERSYDRRGQGDSRAMDSKRGGEREDYAERRMYNVGSRAEGTAVERAGQNYHSHHRKRSSEADKLEPKQVESVKSPPPKSGEQIGLPTTPPRPSSPPRKKIKEDSPPAAATAEVVTAAPAAPTVAPPVFPTWQTMPWPEEEEDNRQHRIRKRNRPAQIPLRERTFYGCSSIDQYNQGDKLGQGTFGEVKKASHFLTGVEVALKKVTIHDEKEGMPITALREIKLLKRLSHPSIVAVIDMAYRGPTERGQLGEVFMVEPYMDHDLNGMLENPSITFTPAQIKLYMKQLFEGTLYMHQNKILHRDMKAANLLINNKGQLQIADFGLARPFHDPGTAWEANGWKGGSIGYTGMVVTRWYRPPELLAGDRRYGPPIDMWGLGCILAEMVTRKPIFKGSSEIEQLDLIAQLCGSPNEQSYPGWNSLPGVKDAIPDQEQEPLGRHDFGSYPRKVIAHFTTEAYSVRDELADLIDKLLVLNPCNRLTAKEALEHKWFWQPPFPADPSALPKYQPSKELDRQRRDQQMHHQQQRAAQAQYQQHQQQLIMSMAKSGMAPSYSNYQQRPSNGHYGRPDYGRPDYGRPGGGYGGFPQHPHSLGHAPPPLQTRPVPRMGMGAQQGHHSNSEPNQSFNPYDQHY